MRSFAFWLWKLSKFTSRENKWHDVFPDRWPVCSLMTLTRSLMPTFCMSHFRFHACRRFVSLQRRLTSNQLERMASGSCLSVFKADGYAVYVLFLLLGTYLLNQLDRYTLAVSSQPMAQDIHFGDKGCLPYNSTFSSEYKDFCVKSEKGSGEPERNQTT